MVKAQLPPPDAAATQPGAETLDDMAREAKAEAPPPDAEAVEGEAIPPPPGAPTEGLRFACSAMVKVLGGIMCARADVKPLSDAEASSVGDALAGVAVFYLPTDGDPRFMAWMTLALALGSVAAPRIREAKEKTADAAKPDGA